MKCECTGTRAPAGGIRCARAGMLYIHLGGGYWLPPVEPTPLEKYVLPRMTCADPDSEGVVMRCIDSHNLKQSRILRAYPRRRPGSPRSRVTSENVFISTSRASWCADWQVAFGLGAATAPVERDRATMLHMGAVLDG